MTARFRRATFAAAASGLVAGFALLLTGCGGNNKPDGTTGGGEADPGTVKVAYLGLTCEAPIFVAHEKGMFKEQGVNVEIVKTDWDGLREGIASGNFHANHTLVMYVLKGIEKGSDMKMTAGVHTGCLRVQVPADSKIKSVAELRGKKIGVMTNVGSPPAMFARRTLAAVGIDTAQDSKEVTLIPFQPEQLGQRLQEGAVDAIATSDPLGTILLGKKVVKTIADQAKDAPYADEYCCAVVVNGEFAKKHPQAAAKVTKGILKAAKWVNENPKAAAELGVEKKYIAASVDINTQALSMLRYVPGVAKGKRSVEQAAEDMKRAKLLGESTNPAALAKRAWLDLEGVTDEWVTAQAVERVPGGRPAPLPADRFAALFDFPKGSGSCLCCTRCCLIVE
jgi:NitT/TauT family transport system substrate-binding protein